MSGSYNAEAQCMFSHLIYVLNFANYYFNNFTDLLFLIIYCCTTVN